jgi:hypothetical protein
VVFSDIHLHDWKTYNPNGERANWGIKAMLEIGKTARIFGVPILFAGDMGHAFGKVSLNLWYQFAHMTNLWIDNGYPPITGISGNHDQEGATYSEESSSKSFWELISIIWPRVYRSVDFTSWLASPQLKVWGIPYLTYNKTLANYVWQMGAESTQSGVFRILLIHTDLHGAVEATGREVGTVEEIPEDMDDFFGRFDLVVSGHIHKRQRLGKKVLIPGSPFQQKKSDMGADYGYWVIFSNGIKLLPKFVPLEEWPRFIQLQPGEEPRDDKNYYIPAEVAPIEEVGDLGFSNTTSKVKLVSRYMKKIGETSVSKKKTLLNLLEDADQD